MEQKLETKWNNATEQQRKQWLADAGLPASDFVASLTWNQQFKQVRSALRCDEWMDHNV